MRCIIFNPVLFICAVALLIAAPLQASAGCTPTPGGAACLSYGCDTLGMTTMDSDGVNLVACLRTSATNATPVWKSMSKVSRCKCRVALVNKGCNGPSWQKNCGGGWYEELWWCGPASAGPAGPTSTFDCD